MKRAAPRARGSAAAWRQRRPARDVDEYLEWLPETARAALERLRRIIQAAAPKADEIISYRIPTYRHRGPLVAFSAAGKHCAFYVMSPSVMEAHEDELEGYATGKATIRFPPDEPLPAKLVQKLVRARIAENEASH